MSDFLDVPEGGNGDLTERRRGVYKGIEDLEGRYEVRVERDHWNEMRRRTSMKGVLCTKRFSRS